MTFSTAMTPTREQGVNMRKTLALTAAVVLSLGAAACGDDETDPADTGGGDGTDAPSDTGGGDITVPEITTPTS
jgi:ABC-type glycerol-3-phosphate transport system substrate-binding protein